MGAEKGLERLGCGIGTGDFLCTWEVALTRDRRQQSTVTSYVIAAKVIHGDGLTPIYFGY